MSELPINDHIVLHVTPKLWSQRAWCGAETRLNNTIAVDRLEIPDEFERDMEHPPTELPYLPVLICIDCLFARHDAVQKLVAPMPSTWDSANATPSREQTLKRLQTVKMRTDQAIVDNLCSNICDQAVDASLVWLRDRLQEELRRLTPKKG